MSIRAACTCGKRLAVRDELAGKRVRCPACKAVVAVPDLEVAVELETDDFVKSMTWLRSQIVERLAALRES